MNREKLTGDIIALEWEFFDKVRNEGGRAACQDDLQTFGAMRASQYDAWDEPLLESWLRDLTEAKAAGRNPLAEKYGYMMCVDEPEANRELASLLPRVSEEKKKLARAVTEKLAPQNEAFAARWPFVASHARPLRGTARGGETSIETYQLGEFFTYSERTLRLLLARVTRLEALGVSYAEQIIENGLKRRGFAGLAEAENFLRSRARGARKFL